MALLTVTLALAVSLSVSAGQDYGPSNRALRVMSGVVKDVTPTDVIVRVGDHVVTFKIDRSTSVSVSGATHRNDLVYRGPYRRQRQSAIPTNRQFSSRRRVAGDDQANDAIIVLASRLDERTQRRNCVKTTSSAPAASLELSCA
jgi:hypothetical protein